MMNGIPRESLRIMVVSACCPPLFFPKEGEVSNRKQKRKRTIYIFLSSPRRSLVRYFHDYPHSQCISDVTLQVGWLYR